MRTHIVTTEISLDGVQENPEQFAFDYHEDATLAVLGQMVEQAEGWTMGRVTYDGMSQVWPGRDMPMADAFNSMPKYVASRTLSEPLAWENSHLLGADPVAGVKQLKQEGDGTIIHFGVGEFTKALIVAGLVDELRFLTFPVVRGGAKNRWCDVLDASTMELIESRAFDKGALLLRYRPLRA